MKVLSLWQPWASLMAASAKIIETRHWATAYRGELAIHAAKRCMHSELAHYMCNPTFRNALFPDPASWTVGKMAAELPFGAIVCVVEIYDCWPTERISGLRQSITDIEKAFGNYEPGRFGWLTRNARKLSSPVRVRGLQSLWNLSPEIEAQVRAQL